MKISLSPSNPEWRSWFAQEKAKLLQILSAEIVCYVEHIGSTAVEELDAKPIVDILLGLSNFEKDAPALVQKMLLSGYIYHPRHEVTMPERRYFTQHYPNTAQTFHIHAVQMGGVFWKRHLLFRNFLRQSPETRNQYQQLKQNLAQQEWNNGSEYAMAKTDFVKAVELAAEKQLFFEI